MATHDGNGNGSGDTIPPSRARLDPRTADLRDPEQLREVLVSIDATAQATVEGMTRIAVAVERTDAAMHGMGPHVAALARESLQHIAEAARTAKAVQSIAESVATLAGTAEAHRRATDGAMFLLDQERIEQGRATMAELEKLSAALAETRATVNELGSARPDVDDLDDVSAVHDINAAVASAIREREQVRELEAARGQLATLHEGERRWRDRKWDVAKMVIGAAVVVVIGWIATLVRLK
jgi:hypothetical protein